MTEKEAMRMLGDTTLCTPLGQAAFVGIKAIKEIQQYRAIGTVISIHAPTRGATAKMTYLFCYFLYFIRQF